MCERKQGSRIGSTALLVLTFAGVLHDKATAQPSLVKVDRVLPQGDEWSGELPGVFYDENFERIGQLRETGHDLGLDDGRFRLSDRDAFSGTRAIEQRYLPRDQHQGDPGSAGWLWRFFGDTALTRRIDDTTPRTRVHARWYHKFEEGFEGIPPKMARMRSFGKDWRPAIYSVYFWMEGDDGRISIERLTNVPGADREWLPNFTTGFTFNQPLNLGRWIHLELALELGDERRADRVLAWADGVLICAAEQDDLAAGFREFTINAMGWDCYWNGGSPKEQSRYYDDLVLSDQPVGPVRAPLNPTLVLTAGPDSIADANYEVEVAEARQTERPRPRQLPQLERTVVWRGTGAGAAEMTVDATAGSFLDGQSSLGSNRLHQVRVRVRTEEGWSDWTPWHGTFATTWEPGTPPDQRTPPTGYLTLATPAG